MGRWTQPQHCPNPALAACDAAAAIVDRPDWWVAAAQVKRAMRRAARHKPRRSGYWRSARREFSRLATRRGLTNLREAS